MNHPSILEVKAVLRTQAELLEKPMPFANMTTRCIRGHQSLCLRYALEIISRKQKNKSS
jgi:hypothetical protein